jgi:Tol biopolymer transport system component
MMSPFPRFRGSVLCLALIACDGETPTGSAPKDPGWIAVSMNIDQTPVQDLFRIRPDGTDLQRITTVGNAGSPSWSPDASRIAYQAWRSNGFGGIDTEIRIHDLTTGATSHVTHFQSRVYDSGPLWTANGGAIFFVSNRVMPEGGLFSIRPDGTDFKRIGDLLPGPSGPDVSRDGRNIAVAYADGLYVGPVTGVGLRRIATSGPNERYVTPRWSPDSRRLLFVSLGSGIFLINADGSGLLPLPALGRSPRSDQQPIWSPDGTMIAFVGSEGLYVVRTDGAGLRLILPGPTHDPSWVR